jgi:hypothetical protein
MEAEFEPEEQKIIDLLTTLKHTEGEYPRKLLASRRQVYLRQIASIGAGLGVEAGTKTIAKAASSKGGALFHFPILPASSIVETILVIAIVAQASIVAYNYRSRIAEFFQSFSSPPTTVPVTGIESSQSETPTVADTPTVLPSSSPTITVTVGSTSTSIDNKDKDIPTATPKPKDDNGNHFGQTPKPSRTKDKKGNGNTNESYNTP